MSCLLFPRSSGNVSRHVPHRFWNPKPLQLREVIVRRLKLICRHCSFCFRIQILTPCCQHVTLCVCSITFSDSLGKVVGGLQPLTMSFFAESYIFSSRFSLMNVFIPPYPCHRYQMWRSVLISAAVDLEDILVSKCRHLSGILPNSSSRFAA